MTILEIYERLKQEFPDVEFALEEIHPDPVIRVPAPEIEKVAKFLCDSEECRFDSLMCLTGVETKEEFQVVYSLYSMKLHHSVTIRCANSLEEGLSVPTVSRVWETAEWHEREAYDFFGIEFIDHPDPRRILLPDDWEGHPLRKNYEAQKEWHGIPLTSPDHKSIND